MGSDQEVISVEIDLKAASAEIDPQEKCIKQLAQNAEKTVKFHSHQTQIDRFTAKTVGQRDEAWTETENQEQLSTKKKT